MTTTHVLREWYSPPEALIWTMWCDTQCIATDDGVLSPPLDFYTEEHAAKASCVECLKGILGKTHPHTIAIPLRHRAKL